MRTLLFTLALVSVAGCADLPADGALQCGPDPAHACPDNFQCIADRCYRNGHGPDASASMGDMASTDLADGGGQAGDGGSGSGGGGGTMSMPDMLQRAA